MIYITKTLEVLGILQFVQLFVGVLVVVSIVSYFLKRS